MATIDATLDSFMIPGLPTYAAEFGTKKDEGRGLSTEECVNVTAMPFSRQRPFAVSETSSTTAVEAHSTFRIEASGITLTLGDAAFEGCTARIANAASGSATVKGTGFTGTIGAGTEAVLAWRGGEWTFEAGDGYAENGIWHVWTAAGLLAWASACSSSMGTGCRMEASIDLTGVTWTPVGTSSNAYTGYFSGGGHSISGLAIDSTSSYQGFFGYIGSGGEAHDLHLDGTCSVKGASYVGGIAGWNSGSISHCSNSGSVSSSSSYAGGIAGANSSGPISHCTNSGAVTLSESTSASAARILGAGGIAGLTYRGPISNCLNTGSVAATGRSTSYDYVGAGGIVGTMDSGFAAHCSNRGTITARTGANVAAGGCIGRINNGGYGTFLVNSGTASASGGNSNSSSAGIAGSINSGGTGSISYYLSAGSPSTGSRGTW